MSLGVFSAGGVIFSSFRVLRQMPGESQAQNRGRRHFSPFLGFPGISGVLLRDPLGGGGVGGVVCCVTFESLVPQPGIDPRPLAVKTQSPTHWIAREFQGISKR